MDATGDGIDLTIDELRAVVRFAADCAATVLPAFEAESPHDRRPREALDAARMFADGAPRSSLQRTTAVAAHRSAKEAPTESARLAALACGDAAAAAYLHPIARATQVGHILRAAACAARVAEVAQGESSPAGIVDTLARRAAPPVPEVLRRYPPAVRGASPLARLLSALDDAIRARD